MLFKMEYHAIHASSKALSLQTVCSDSRTDHRKYKPETKLQTLIHVPPCLRVSSLEEPSASECFLRELGTFSKNLYSASNPPLTNLSAH